MKQLLSPKELASAIGVSQSSIKRWADEGLICAARTAGGHRRIHVSEAIRFVRESDIVLVRPHLLGLPENTRVGRGTLDLEASASELIGYLEAGSERESAGLIFSLYLSGCHLAQIVDGPVRVAMADLG
ncbi:MAG: MerR family DNA-binding transcriptional regulator, partial [Holophagales bacterium]|nr:MerR family DNA-binding transcriptional regulator [Holophagales bacterium]